MSKYSHNSNYIYYENTGIPISKLNIRSQSVLEAEERKLLVEGYEYFHKNLSESTTFDESYFKKLHRITFGKLYTFAGKYRTINISKGYSTFCQVRFLEQTSKEIFNKLAAENYLKDFGSRTKEDFAKKNFFFYVRIDCLASFF